MIRAVFFDWGNTLVAWEFDPELFVEGHVRGLAAFGAGAPSQPAFTDAYSRRLLPLLVGEREDEVDYAAEIGSALRLARRRGGRRRGAAASSWPRTGSGARLITSSLPSSR